MNAAAAKERLEELIRGKNPVMVSEEQSYPMTATIVRQRFDLGKEFQVTAEGVAVRKWDGTWLYVREQSQPGGPL